MYSGQVCASEKQNWVPVLLALSLIQILTHGNVAASVSEAGKMGESSEVWKQGLV